MGFEHHITSLISPPFIEVTVQNLESVLSCIHVLGVQTVWYFFFILLLINVLILANLRVIKKDHELLLHCDEKEVFNTVGKLI